MKRYHILCLILTLLLILSTTINTYAEQRETKPEAGFGNWIEFNNGDECTVTCYCLCPKCCGPGYVNNITASGVSPMCEVTVANGKLPFGTRVYIEDVGYRLVQDRGSQVGDTHFDVYVGIDNHEVAKDFALQKKRVWVIE